MLIGKFSLHEPDPGLKVQVPTRMPLRHLALAALGPMGSILIPRTTSTDPLGHGVVVHPVLVVLAVPVALPLETCPTLLDGFLLAKASLQVLVGQLLGGHSHSLPALAGLLVPTVRNNNNRHRLRGSKTRSMRQLALELIVPTLKPSYLQSPSHWLNHHINQLRHRLLLSSQNPQQRK